MQDLQLVGVHDDGEHVLLTGADGQRYRLLVDERLRAAVRRDRARLGQLQIQIEGGLRPRDIQARIRAGESAEDVADASGLPIEHVRKFEGPVLAEREHVAQRAQGHVARSSRSGDSPPLGQQVAERLTARGVTDGGTWDAWRGDEGVWTVQLAFRAGSKDRHARWAYDLVSRTLEPLDDESRWLSASDTAEDGPLPGRRLAAVKERVYDVEADGGVRESGRAAGSVEPTPAPEQEAVPLPATVELLDQLRARRGRRQPVLSPEEMAELDDAGLGDVDPGSAGPGGAGPGIGLHVPEPEPPAAHPPASRPQDAVDAEILALPEVAEPADRSADTDDGPASRDDEPGEKLPDDAEDAPADGAARAGRRAPVRSKARRPSVPSWDEIVFGAKKD